MPQVPMGQPDIPGMLAMAERDVKWLDNGWFMQFGVQDTPQGEQHLVILAHVTGRREYVLPCTWELSVKWREDWQRAIDNHRNAGDNGAGAPGTVRRTAGYRASAGRGHRPGSSRA